MRTDRLKTILDKINADPGCWDQTKWHCGTSHCIAGHCQVEMLKENKGFFGRWMADNLPGSYDIGTVLYDGMDWLEISVATAQWLFDSGRSLKEIKGFYCDEVRKEQAAAQQQPEPCAQIA